MERGDRGGRRRGAGGGRARCQWQCAGRWRQRHRDQGSQDQGIVLGRQRRHQGQEHPPPGCDRRARHRLQDRRHRRDESEIGVRAESVSRRIGGARMTMNGNRYYGVRVEGAKYGVGFGSALAIAISYTNNHSILWAIIHGILGWLYVIYVALFG